MTFDLNNFLSSFMEQSSSLSARIDKNAILKAVLILDEARRNDKAVFLIGNGGSAGTASHFSADLEKWAAADVDKCRIRTKCLTDNTSQITALFNDLPKEDLFIEQLKTHFRRGDVVIGISVHGGKGADKGNIVWSQNLTKALAYANDNGGKTIGMTGFDGGAMKDLCTVNINVPADSTPLVEGFHVVLFHAIVDALNKMATEGKEFYRA